MGTYGIDFNNGITVITSDWDTVARYINGGDVLMVIIRETGEILYDAPSGYDIVTHA